MFFCGLHLSHIPQEKVVQTNKHDIKDVSDDGETAECSFSPQVNRTSSMSNSLNLAKSLCSHPGEQKCVQRMRKGENFIVLLHISCCTWWCSPQIQPSIRHHEISRKQRLIVGLF